METNSTIYKAIAAHLFDQQKGILAIDESPTTLSERFALLGLYTRSNDRTAYRRVLITSPNLSQYISGVILHREALDLKIDGVAVTHYLEEQGILLGVKVDDGPIASPFCLEEIITRGSDKLWPRFVGLYERGVRLVKWRALFRIGPRLPSVENIQLNSYSIALFVLTAFRSRLMPIIEIDMIGYHEESINVCFDATGRVLKQIFETLATYKVDCSNVILKINYVTQGIHNTHKTSLTQIAASTLDCLRAHLPKSLGGVLFFCGGQSPTHSTYVLQEITRLSGGHACEGPRLKMGFSYGQVTQENAMVQWVRTKDRVRTQQVLLHRLKMNCMALKMLYHPQLDYQTAE